jgi:sugar lactone lactonase YvrE
LNLNASIDYIPGINLNTDLSVDAENRLIITDGEDTRITYLDGEEMGTLYTKIKSMVLEAMTTGFYFGEEGNNRIGYFDFAAEKTTYFETPGEVSGIALNAEQTFLNVIFKDELFGYSYKIGSDKSLSDEQAYIDYHVPYGEKTASPTAAVIDTSNFLYTVTNMGVQVSDQIGKVHMILPTPNKLVTDIAWAGKDFNTLYVVSAGQIYFRRLNTKGQLSIDKPLKPGRPKL